MATRSNDYVFDELLCFLSNPLFQVPVLSFMENNCLIFDTSTEDSEDYRQIHEQYRKLVDALLEAFRSDTGLTHDQIIQAMRDFNAKPELRKVFHELFEQVLAMDDLRIFVHLMITRNLELQKQALMLITMMHGHLPSSLQDSAQSSPTPTTPTPPNPPNPRAREEEEVLRAILEQSKQEYEAQQKQSRQDEDELKAVLNISQIEAQRLQTSSHHEQEKLSQVMKSSLRIGDGPSSPAPAPEPLASLGDLPTLPKEASKPPAVMPVPAQPHPASVASSQATPVPKTTPPASKAAPLAAKHDLYPTLETGNKASSGQAAVKGVHQGVGDKTVSSRDAAANWLKTAESEVKSSDAHSQAVYAAAASMAGLSEAEYEKRVHFLKQQRDKLMEMKRREREKQVLSAASTQPQRPASARAARNALRRPENAPEPAAPSEEDKKLAMRKAIASRIKSELMEQENK